MKLCRHWSNSSTLLPLLNIPNVTLQCLEFLRPVLVHFGLYGGCHGSWLCSLFIWSDFVLFFLSPVLRQILREYLKKKPCLLLNAICSKVISQLSTLGCLCNEPALTARRVPYGSRNASHVVSIRIRNYINNFRCSFCSSFSCSVCISSMS
jgi:hypothetical protein